MLNTRSNGIELGFKSALSGILMTVFSTNFHFSEYLYIYLGFGGIASLQQVIMILHYKICHAYPGIRQDMKVSMVLIIKLAHLTTFGIPEGLLCMETMPSSYEGK